MEDTFLPQLENTMLNAAGVELRSVKGIQPAFIVENERPVNASDGPTQAEVEHFLETDGIAVT